MQPRKHNAVLPVAVIVGLMGALALWFWLQQRPLPTPLKPPDTGVTSLHPTNPAPAPLPTANVAEKLRSLSSELAGLDRVATQARLAQLRRDLASMPKSEALAALRRFLDSKADAPTHQGFKVAKGGLLDEAPTLRTFLLDELARLDRPAAADYAKVILASKDSPDEWAVALRNLARGDLTPEDRSLLEHKTEEMLSYTPWQQNPSTGFLEAFDTAVYLGGTNLLPTLSDLVRRQDNPALAHASYLALDRLVLNDPAGTLSALESNTDLMQGRELTRANYFARADVRDPQQRQVLERYLLDPRVGTAELETFAGLYPNANFMISANLLTSDATLDHASLVGRDAEAFRVLQDWLADPRFASLGPQLRKVQARLGEFIRQEGGH